MSSFFYLAALNYLQIKNTMKKLLLVFLALTPLFTFSQSFVVTPNGLRNSDNEKLDYLEINFKGSNAEDLMKASYIYITQIMPNLIENPRFSMANKYIKYRIFEPSFIGYNHSGAKRQIQAYYDVELQIEDEKATCRILNLDMPAEKSKYNLIFMGDKWKNSVIYTQDGDLFKVKEKGYIENYFNSKLKEYIVYVFNNRLKSFKN